MRKMMKNHLNSLRSGPTEVSKLKSHSVLPEPEERSRAVRWVNWAWRSLETGGGLLYTCGSATVSPFPYLLRPDPGEGQVNIRFS